MVVIGRAVLELAAVVCVGKEVGVSGTVVPGVTSVVLVGKYVVGLSGAVLGLAVGVFVVGKLVTIVQGVVASVVNVECGVVGRMVLVFSVVETMGPP